MSDITKNAQGVKAQSYEKHISQRISGEIGMRHVKNAD